MKQRYEIHKLGRVNK